jgi:hypoxanthine phosphoribosyltransferase
MQADIDRVLISRQQIASRVKQLADQIALQYRDSPGGLVLVCILSGALIFLADLIRHLPMRMRIGLIGLSSYPGPTTAAHPPRLIKPLDIDIRIRHVLLIDDILDTGQTLRQVLDQLRQMHPASLRVCVLLRKPAKAPPDLVPDFLGFDIEDLFVVGYGLDYDDQYRNWPDIAVLKPQAYASAAPLGRTGQA